MGRPLKIAQSQAVLTLTGTSASTQLVTTSGNLTSANVIKGMPFVVTSNIGGLVAGTTYYVNSVASSTTFSVSSTQLSVQPQTVPTLTNTSGQTIAATVGLVDYGFNNPNGSNTAQYANTWGVVGGNTAQYGKQVAVTVAIGANGTGTLFTSTTSPRAAGLNTNFATNVANGAVIQIPVANINGIQTDYTTVGYVTGTPGNNTIAVANTTATGNVIGTSGNALTLIANAPVIFDNTFGGLTAGNVYYVKTTPNASAFTVSASVGGAPVQLTSNGSVTGNALQDTLTFTSNAAVAVSNSAFIQATPEAGYINRQKGKIKYLVTGLTSGLTGQCYTANVANTAMLPNTMIITGTYANSSTVNLFNLDDYQSEVYTAWTYSNALVVGTQYTIANAGNTLWTSVGARDNMTGITFTATGNVAGTGFAIAANANPDVIATFGTAYTANVTAGQPNPVITINNA